MERTAAILHVQNPSCIFGFGFFETRFSPSVIDLLCSGYSYSLVVEVSESQCSLDEEYDLVSCESLGLGSDICTITVKQPALREKLPRGISITQLEITKAFCKTG